MKMNSSKFPQEITIQTNQTNDEWISLNQDLSLVALYPFNETVLVSSPSGQGAAIAFKPGWVWKPLRNFAQQRWPQLCPHSEHQKDSECIIHCIHVIHTSSTYNGKPSSISTGQLQNVHLSLNPVTWQLEMCITPRNSPLLWFLGPPSCRICHLDTQEVVRLGRTRHCKWSLTKVVPWSVGISRFLSIAQQKREHAPNYPIFFGFWDKYLLHISFMQLYSPKQKHFNAMHTKLKCLSKCLQCPILL